MEYETEEQQVEALKEWWSENGRAVIAGVVLGVGVIGGWSLWQKRAESQAIAASDGYSLAMEAVEACLLYTSPSPRDQRGTRMPSSA